MRYNIAAGKAGETGMWYPLRFAPLYYEKVWGDRRLETVLGRTLPDGPIGESWEVADHPHGHSVVANGPMQGETLHAQLERDPEGLLGAHVLAARPGLFPLLVKYIDADDMLSVQVHPDDAYAQAHAGDLGKTEMWYILHADPGAEIIAGLRDGVTEADYRRAVESGDPAALLRRLPVRSGDAILIPAGRIHALLPGLLVLEIQENSDTTYRVYDWDRVGLDGKPRELHVAQALAVTDWLDDRAAVATPQVETLGANRRSILTTCPYFTVERYDVAADFTFRQPGDRFAIVNVVAGTGRLAWTGGEETLRVGDTLFLPAALAEVILTGNLSLLVSYVP